MRTESRRYSLIHHDGRAGGELVVMRRDVGRSRPLGWLYVSQLGAINSTPRLRRLAHAILRAIGDPVPARSPRSGEEDGR